jgi:hypothetical protein
VSHVQAGHVRLDLEPFDDGFYVHRGGLRVGTVTPLGGAGWSLKLDAHPHLTWSWPTPEAAAESAALWLVDQERSEGFRAAAARGDLR